MSGFVIDTFHKDIGTSYSEPGVTFTQPLQGSYQLLHSDVGDGIFPIIWTGANDTLHVMRVSDSSDWVITFDELKSDDPSDIETFFKTQFEAGLSFLTGSSTTMTTDDDGVTYTLGFSEDIILVLSNASSKMKHVWGDDDIATVSGSCVVSGYHMDTRPHLIAIDINQASMSLSFVETSFANLIISTRDENIRDNYLSIPDQTFTLNLKVYRLNVPNVVCPIENIPIIIFFQRPLSFSSAI